MPGRLRRSQFGARFDVSVAGEGIVRAAALLGIPPLLREFGIDPADVLSSVGLASEALDHPDRTLSYIDAGRVLQRAAEVTGCAHFGLLVGQRNSISSLGILGEVMLRSANTQAALRSLILHMHLQTRGGVPTHTVEGPNATLGYAIYQRGMPATTQVYDLAMAYEFNVLRGLCGQNWAPVEVSFSTASPRTCAPIASFSPCRCDLMQNVPRLCSARRGLRRCLRIRMPNCIASSSARSPRRNYGNPLRSPSRFVVR